MRRAWLVLACAAALGAEPEYVKLPSGLEMQKTEVTVEQFRAFVEATGHQTVAEKAQAERTWRNPGFAVVGRQPVVYVNYKDAEAFCRWKGARLPTEGEWEYANRAGAATTHSWGEGLDERYVWYRENSDGAPQPVGTKAANPWGLHDMAGNVWGWTTGERYVFRGGSWMSCPKISPWATEGEPLLRVPVVTRQDMADDDLGFRCVRAGVAGAKP